MSDFTTLEQQLDELGKELGSGSELLLERLSSQLTRSDGPIAPSSRSHRSFLMRHAYHFTTVAAAALLLAAGWVILASPASIALADIIEATMNHKIVRCNLHTSAEVKMKWHADREEEFVPATSEEVVYFDLTSPRFRIERHETTLNDTVQSDWVTIQDNKRDRALVTSSLELIVTEDQDRDENQIRTIKMFKDSGDAGKKARLFRISGDGIIPFTNMKTDKTFLEILQAFQNRADVASTRDVFEGRETWKYQLYEPAATLTLWVDLKTKLPVRIEQEIRNPHPNRRRQKWVFGDFQWNVEVGNLDEFFSIRPPAGYPLEDHTNGR